MPLKKIAQRIRKDAVVTVDTITDYSSRMSARLGLIGEHLDRIEIINKGAADKLEATIKVVQAEALTRNEGILRILTELHGIITESGEELSQVSINLTTAKREIEQGEKLARDSRHDLTNVEMLAQTGKLWTQSDADTVGVIIADVELPIFQEALERQTPKRWLELERAFEAAKKSRNG